MFLKLFSLIPLLHLYIGLHLLPALPWNSGAVMAGALALRGAPPDVRTRILLAHQPRSAPAAEPAGYQLQISGHTHGGQFLPWNFLVRLQQPFTAGLATKRVGAPSEITVIRLVRTEAG